MGDEHKTIRLIVDVMPTRADGNYEVDDARQLLNDLIEVGSLNGDDARFDENPIKSCKFDIKSYEGNN